MFFSHTTYYIYIIEQVNIKMRKGFVVLVTSFPETSMNGQSPLPTEQPCSVCFSFMSAQNGGFRTIPPRVAIARPRCKQTKNHCGLLQICTSHHYLSTEKTSHHFLTKFHQVTFGKALKIKWYHQDPHPTNQQLSCDDQQFFHQTKKKTGLPRDGKWKE